MNKDYKYSLKLPKTSFPMKAKLPLKEADILKFWHENEIHKKIYQKGNKTFTLHDGPPYANGHIHMGHALNKILKDIVNRFHSMSGYKIHFIPGWDCHGLPIEWQIEEIYRKESIDKKNVNVLEFRKKCRDYAEKWMKIQKKDFIRLGINADWDKPYTTMSNHAVATIISELSKIILKGAIYKRYSPVMWSSAEKTALAEAEIEYIERKSPSIMTCFAVNDANAPENIKDAYIVIWTTTPWTLPANRAIAYSSEQKLVLLRVDIPDNPEIKKIILGENRMQYVLQKTNIQKYQILARIEPHKLQNIITSHPLEKQGYKHKIPLLCADFIDINAGTGFVHIAPSHGRDDFELGLKHNLDIPQMIDEDGRFHQNLPLIARKFVFDANPIIIEALARQKKLLYSASLRHSYPHSWRSFSPLIFRLTEQFFISMKHDGLRDNALRLLDKVNFYPQISKNRIFSMIKNRPDWCISRQRSWGVPITIFTHRQSGEILKDQKVIDRIIDEVKLYGCDTWFKEDPAKRFLPPDYDPQDYIAAHDILDVWFDSGSSHAFVLNPAKNPADLYLEGSDQHRGWFQSSLLEACATRKESPYKNILTHGFVLDGKGRKMSKSLGNVISPQDIIDKYGADILRLWVAISDYYDDIRLGQQNIDYCADAYRRIRNCLRFMMGNLPAYTQKLTYPSNPPLLEKWILMRLLYFTNLRKKAMRNYKFNEFYNQLLNFCVIDLSAFYFDIRKDCFYCDHAENPKRIAAVQTTEIIFDALCKFFAPVLCFTTEEAWLIRNPHKSIHLTQFPDIPESWENKEIEQKLQTIRDFRKDVTWHLERAREKGEISSSLEAHPIATVGKNDFAAMQGIDLAEICITSSFTLKEGELQDDKLDDKPDDKNSQPFGIEISPALGQKCPRCWRIHQNQNQLCQRCLSIIHPET